MWRSTGLLFLILCMLAGCSQVLSEKVMRDRDPLIKFAELKKAPEDHTGKLMIVGGTIIRLTHDESGSLLEVLQRPLDSNLEPLSGDETGGRFLIRTKHPMTDQLFQKARKITVAGLVLGSETRPLDQTTYTYPVLSLEDFYVWPERGNGGGAYPMFSFGIGFRGSF